MNELLVANRNINLYIFIRVFAKRVFLPLTAIYFIETAGFTIKEIGLLSGFFSFIQLLAEIPTGYFADKIGRVASIRVAGLLAATATMIYAFVHIKSGIYIGVMLEALAYSFLGGAGEALIHDSLVVKNEIHNYTKLLSKTMSISLVANAILIILVPMTYKYDPRYPFIIGSLLYLLLFVVAMFMQDVKRSNTQTKLKIPNYSAITGKKNILMFGVTFGIIAALYTSTSDIQSIALKQYGVPVDQIGWIYGIASVVGASIGYFMHYLRKLRLSKYLLIDIFMVTILFLAGYSQNAIFLSGAMIASISFWRYRRIIYQDYLLTIYPTRYKATLISALSNLEQLNSIWITIMTTTIIGYTSISTGLGIVGLFALAIAPVFYFQTLKFFKQDKLSIKLENIAQSVV